MAGAQSVRRGFTLVEVLVVVAIIAVLVGLLMPAVQAARESARRVSCQNNMKQISLAAAGHVHQIGTFPSGGWSWQNGPDPNAGHGEMQPGSWIYNSLSFMDGQTLRDQGVGKTGAARNAAVRTVVETPLAVVTCPSRRAPTTHPFVHAGCFVGLERPARISPTDYAGCAGSVNEGANDICTTAACTSASNDGIPASRLPSADREKAWQKSGSYPHRVAGVNESTYANGVVGILGRVKPAHVKDGLSNTFLAGERVMYSVRYSSSYCENDQGWTVGLDWDTVRWTANPPIQDRKQPSASSDKECQGRFGGPHPGTFVMTFCDGAVRAISYGIDPAIFKGLGSRNGSEVVDPTAF
jgi:prepilin-type N-terminal cleavage/methylation domain-containing protein